MQTARTIDAPVDHITVGALDAKYTALAAAAAAQAQGSDQVCMPVVCSWSDDNPRALRLSSHPPLCGASQGVATQVHTVADCGHALLVEAPPAALAAPILAALAHARACTQPIVPAAAAAVAAVAAVAVVSWTFRLVPADIPIVPPLAVLTNGVETLFPARRCLYVIAEATLQVGPYLGPI